MEFEDKLRAQFAKADAWIADERLNHHEVIGRGKRMRTVRLASIVTAIAVAAGGVWFATDVLPSGGIDGTPSVGPSDLLVPPEDVSSGECSAAADARPVDAGSSLPDAVREMREEIVYAAWACDFDRLERLASAGPERHSPEEKGELRFLAGIDDEPRPEEDQLSEYWRERDESGDPAFAITKLLVRVLRTSSAEVTDGSGTFVWPAAVITRRTEDFRELEDVYDMRFVKGGAIWREQVGYRLQITPDGDWTAFTPEPGDSLITSMKKAVSADDVASFTPSGTSEACSGSREAHTGHEQPDLPAAVNEVRRDIITRTWTCDYEGLEEIAVDPKGSSFDYKRGGRDSDPGPAAYWREREALREPIMATIVETLESKPMEAAATEDTIYIWEAPIDVAGSDGRGGAIGFRVLITEDGDWIAARYVY